MKTCKWSGKQSYASEQIAKKARNAMGHRTNVNELRIYQCPNCFMYHFTSRKD